MKYKIKNQYSERTLFVAEIEATQHDPESVQLGRAVKCAVEHEADLSDAQLGHADLKGLDLRSLKLRGANFWHANLKFANLNGLDLTSARFSGADLSRATLVEAKLCRATFGHAKLTGTNLQDADLRDASFGGAHLRSTDFSNADLSDASFADAPLRGVTLRGAELRGADFRGSVNVDYYVRTIAVEEYPIIYTAETLQIGCRIYPISDWKEFDDARILRMGGRDALRFWRKWKDWIFQTIEMAPAKPTRQPLKKVEAA